MGVLTGEGGRLRANVCGVLEDLSKYRSFIFNTCYFKQTNINTFHIRYINIQLFMVVYVIFKKIVSSNLAASQCMKITVTGRCF